MPRSGSADSGRMVPLHELLARIRWDEGFAAAHFEIAYLDHVEKRLIRIDLGEMRPDPESHSMFCILDRDGNLLSVPYHRVKQVFRNGELIWQREH